MHSAKKWDMMHPDYKGGDGELLWNIYYGDFSDDERFDDFRRDQLWDAEVIRPIIEMDVKYERFQLNHQALNVGRQSSRFQLADYKWAMVVFAAIVVIAAFVAWKKRPQKFVQIAEPETTQPLMHYQATN